jgi:hypothetical protein
LVDRGSIHCSYQGRLVLSDFKLKEQGRTLHQQNIGSRDHWSSQHTDNGKSDKTFAHCDSSGWLMGEIKRYN